MCDCDEKKECCGCLKGGCECICECGCHEEDAYLKRLNCPDCIARRADWNRRLAELYKDLERQAKEVPSDEEILRAFGGRDII